jgi:hypothetical protein
MEWMQHIAMLAPELIRRTIVLTGNHLPVADRGRIREVGAGLLLKPFDSDGLLEAIRTTIGAPTTRLKPVKPPAGSFRPIPDDTE